MHAGQWWLALGLALSLFAVLLIGEQYQWNLIQYRDFPLPQDLKITDIRPDPSQTQAHVTQSGELWVMSPGIKFDADKRTLVAGKLFLGSHFIADEDLLSNRIFNKTYQQQKTLSHATVGQIRAGPLWINLLGGGVLISRHSNNTNIVSLDHEVEIFFAGAQQPFVLLPRQQVSIDDDVIQSHTGELFYSKLRKVGNFNLRPFENLSGDFLNDDIGYFSILSLAVKEHKKLEKKIIAFAKNNFLTWDLANLHHTADMVRNWWRGLQGAVIIVGANDFRQKQLAQDLLHDFLLAYFSAIGKGTRVFQASLNNFALTYNSAAWNDFMRFYPQWQTRWDNFIWAQKRWIFSGKADKKIRDFYDQWMRLDKSMANDWWFQQWTMIESLWHGGSNTEAYDLLIELANNKDVVSIDNLPLNFFTNKRRSLIQTIYTQEFFQDEAMIDFLIALAKKELSIADGRSWYDELVLEIAKDALSLVNHFVFTQPNPDLSRLLVRFYAELDVGRIAAQLGRKNIFSKEELQTIEFIDFVGDSGLSLEDMEKMQKNFLERQERVNLVADRISSTHSSSPVRADGAIVDAQTLGEFLLNKGVDVQQMKTEPIVDGVLNFSNVIFNGKILQGSFRISVQNFRLIQSGDIKQKNINKNKLDGFLALVLQNMTDKKTTQRASTAVVAQNTEKARLARNDIWKIFTSEGFKIGFDDVKLSDNSLNNFILTGLLWERDYELDLRYDYLEDRVNEIKLNTTLSHDLDLGAESYERAGLGKKILSLIKESTERLKSAK